MNKYRDSVGRWRAAIGGIRRRLGYALASPIASRIVRPLHEAGGRTVTILAYHRVLPAPISRDYPFDTGLISATPEQFRWQMEYLRRECNVLPLSAIGGYLSGRVEFPPRAVVVTFDDGFLDNYVHAYPVLRACGIPATIFVATSYIGADRPFWFEMIVYVMMRAEVGSVEIEGIQAPLPTGDSIVERRKSARMLLSHLKNVPHEQLLANLERCLQKLGSRLRTDDFSLSRTMSWDQVREMAAAGVEFGSHTETHPILAQVTPEQLRRELVGSRNALETELQRPITQLAYPIGRAFAFNEDVIFEAGRAGYRLAASYIPGCNRSGAIRPFALRRQNVESYVGPADFKVLVNMPSWFH